jgi:chromosome segregation ATPase
MVVLMIYQNQLAALSKENDKASVMIGELVQKLKQKDAEIKGWKKRCSKAEESCYSHADKIDELYHEKERLRKVLAILKGGDGK